MENYLTSKEILKINGFLDNVVHIDVKKYPNGSKEAMLEYQNGDKYVLDLNAINPQPQKLEGITSIAAYFARGHYGSKKCRNGKLYRGNCSGNLIKDLLQHYKPNTFADFAVGGGTSIDVAHELGYKNSNTFFNDLNPEYGGMDVSSNELDAPLSDFIFWHPPYFVFKNSAMPMYSGVQWGDIPQACDGSHIHDPNAFKSWFDTCNANLYRLLKKGGRLAILMGDSKYRGHYYSMFKNMDIFGELEQIIVKEQFNTLSARTKYSGRFIPTEHEFLVIIRKNDSFIVPIACTRFFKKDIRNSDKTTWSNLIAMILEESGGALTIDELVHCLEQTKKAENNHHVRAKVRQVIQQYNRLFERTDNVISLIA